MSSLESTPQAQVIPQQTMRPVEYMRIRASLPCVVERRALYLSAARKWRLRVNGQGWTAYEGDRPVSLGLWTTIEEFFGESACLLQKSSR